MVRSIIAVETHPDSCKSGCYSFSKGYSFLMTNSLTTKIHIKQKDVLNKRRHFNRSRYKLIQRGEVLRTLYSSNALYSLVLLIWLR